LIRADHLGALESRRCEPVTEQTSEWPDR